MSIFTKKKRIISITAPIFLCLLIVPQVAFAAWWNPFTWDVFLWFKQPQTHEQVVIPTTPTSTTTEQTNAPSQKITPAVPVQKVVTPPTSTQISKPIQNNVPPAQASQQTQTVSADVRFQILDIKNDVGDEEATVTWRTTLAARSRLILTSDGKVYESLSGVGTEHQVTIKLEPNMEYDYHITARTLDEKSFEDDVYNSFKGPVELVAVLGKFEDDCRTIIIQNTAGKPISNMEVTVRAIQKNDMYVSYRPYLTKKTNSNGEIKYCESGNTYEVSGEDLWAKLP